MDPKIVKNTSNSRFFLKTCECAPDTLFAMYKPHRTPLISHLFRQKIIFRRPLKFATKLRPPFLRKVSKTPPKRECGFVRFLFFFRPFFSLGAQMGPKALPGPPGGGFEEVLAPFWDGFWRFWHPLGLFFNAFLRRFGARPPAPFGKKIAIVTPPTTRLRASLSSASRKKKHPLPAPSCKNSR